jgi:hypothetical protein
MAASNHTQHYKSAAPLKRFPMQRIFGIAQTFVAALQTPARHFRFAAPFRSNTSEKLDEARPMRAKTYARSGFAVAKTLVAM